MAAHNGPKYGAQTFNNFANTVVLRLTQTQFSASTDRKTEMISPKIYSGIFYFLFSPVGKI
jgi:hypothetical protein